MTPLEAALAAPGADWEAALAAPHGVPAGVRAALTAALRRTGPR